MNEPEIYTPKTPEISSPNKVQLIANIILEQATQKLPTSKINLLQRLSPQTTAIFLATLALLSSVGCNNSKEPNPIPTIAIPAPTTTPLSSWIIPDRFFLPSEPYQPRPTPTFKPIPGQIEPSPTPEISPYSELPSDVIPVEELKEKHHTTIWNTDKVKLSLRKAALTDEVIFKQIQTARSNGIDANLHIVLIPGEIVYSKYLTPEQRKNLPDLVDRLAEYEPSKEDFISRREEMKQHWERDLAIIAQMLKNNDLTETSAQRWRDLSWQEYKPYIEGPYLTVSQSILF